MNRSEEIQFKQIQVGGTITLLSSHDDDNSYIGTPLTVEAVCDPFVIVEYNSKALGIMVKVVLDSRFVTFGTLSLDYIEAYNAN